MKLSEIYKIADGLAPKTLSDEYCAEFEAYDNSGILIDTGEEIQGVLCSLDLSFAAIEKAKKIGANLIITHHPAMYGKLNHARYNGTDLVEQKLVQCLKNGISVISMHLNLDVAMGGVDESLAQGVCEATGSKNQSLKNLAIMHSIRTGGYGRAYDVKESTVKDLSKGLQTIFKTRRLLVYGNEEQKISRIASFCGAGADEVAVLFAKEQGAQAIVSSDFKHHVLTTAVESGLAVFALTHYASEAYGMKKYYEKIRQQLAIPCEYHMDDLF